ncbi:hypothetical protein [Aneurinibacillus terranovensis]|uniref:hypothetical protein n=1 Tax=Aneurinibacillus terranovensis TaxID=278991 RepID=UPI0004136EB4|nr:hypothetical protein [Aneurinibacillus terranovensis]
MARSGRMTVLILFVIAALAIVCFILWSQLQAQKMLVASYKEKVDSLSGVTQVDAKKVNDLFIERFFNYQNTADRYKNIKEIMTRQGLQAAHPSGGEIPEKGADVTASVRNVQTYEYTHDRTHVEYINTFIQTLSYNGENSNATMMIKTKLLYMDGLGWKIDDLENIPLSSQPIKILGS